MHTHTYAHTGLVTEAVTGVSAAAEGGGRPGISLTGKLELLSFCVFEGCVGVFWPTQARV